MDTPSTRDTNFNKLHRNFSETCQIINEYVVEIYRFPKKLIDETEPVVDKYIRNCIYPGSPRSNNPILPNVITFINDLDHFTTQTFALYDQHKQHTDKSIGYLRKVKTIANKRVKEGIEDTKADLKLCNELMELNQALQAIKNKADDMVLQLETLELNWRKIRHKIKD